MPEQPLKLDFSQDQSTKIVLPNMPVLTSYESSWQNIHLAHHRQPPLEIPEVASNQHVIYLPNSQRSAKVECVLEGRLQEVHFRKKEYQQGYIGILPADRPYKLCWNVEVEFTHFYLEPAFLAHIAHESVNPDKVELSWELKKVDWLIYNLGLALKADLESTQIGDRFYSDSLATALAAHLIQNYATRKHQFSEFQDGLSSIKLRQALAYINEHLGENLSLTAIANELDMSQYYFCRLFKQSLGITPHQYLIRQRIERAEQLLQRSNLTITAIAIECGFTNQSHFAKHFRKQTGLNPKEFRNS